MVILACFRWRKTLMVYVSKVESGRSVTKRIDWPRILASVVFIIAATLWTLGPSKAVEAVEVPLGTDALDLTQVAEFIAGSASKLQTSTAPGTDGVVQRIEVTALNEANENWLVFALSNPTDEQIERLIVAPHFRLAGSGLLRPDLGSKRIVAITPDAGFTLTREDSPDSDVFRIILDPGAVKTYVAELSTDRVPQLYLWQPDAYKDNINSFTLYKGIVIGISGLLALFLTIVFVVKGTIMFPATAALAWAVLGYLSIDFGFWDQIFAGDTSADPLYRAGAESLISVTLVVFLYGYLNLNRWHNVFTHGALALSLALSSLFVLAFFDPPVAAGVSRFMMAVIGLSGLALLIYFALRSYDRAIMLIPAWLLLLCWLAGAGLTVSGQLVNDIAQPALAGGLVLIVLLMGFTVVQHAFSGGSVATGPAGDTERKALAFVGSGDLIWDWDAARDRISTSLDTEEILGLSPGALEGSPRHWLEVLHPDDRDKFRTTLDAMIEKRRGRISQTLRLRAADGHYRWLHLRARPIVGSDGEVVRCVGSLNDVTEFRLIEERLLHDAVRDNLTGLPNREIFFDRLDMAITMARMEGGNRPSVVLVDLDRMRVINDRLGLSVGDSILLTVGRRLSRILKPQDAVTRIARDQFAIILLSEQEPERVAAFADAVRRTIRTPVNFGDQNIALTASIGVAMYDQSTENADRMLQDSELAMTRAKNLGGDRIEAFRTHMREFRTATTDLEADLTHAVSRGELMVLYQPIIRLKDRSIVGFEALIRWDHPNYGRIMPQEFMPLAERTDLIFEIGVYAMDRAVRDIREINNAYELNPPLFVSVNVSSRQLLRNDLINEVKGVLTRNNLPPACLKLELTETLMIENPDFTAIVMARIKELGASLALDDFGTGYASIGYLQRLPIDTLKIDKSFVSRKQPNHNPMLLGSMVKMAHDLGMDVVAEGIETEEEARNLQSLNCEFGQGFYFGHPMSAQDVASVISRQSKQAAE